jgi:hypothetical protein
MDGTLWVEMKQSWRRLLPETLMREFRTPQSQHEAGESPSPALSNRDACGHTNETTILLVDDNELVLDVMPVVFVTGLPTDPLEPLRQDEEVLLKPLRVHEHSSATARACIKL